MRATPISRSTIPTACAPSRQSSPTTRPPQADLAPLLAARVGPGPGPGRAATYETTVVTRVLRDLDVPFVTFDQFGRLMDVSPAAERMIGAAGVPHFALACQSLALRAVTERAGTGLPAAADVDRWSADVLGWSVVVRALPSGDSARVAVGVITPPLARDGKSRSASLDALTPRERDVAELLASGASTKAIAHALDRSIHTVRRHTDRIFAKLGVASRTQLANALRC